MPKIKMTRTVKIALFFLQFYLLFILVLILIKFIKVIS